MIRIDDRELQSFAAQLREFPKEMRRDLRPKLRAAGEDLAAEARANASWSDRIPGAISVRVSFAAGNRGGVGVRVDAAKAPHARPLEMGSKGARPGILRHPFFASGEETRDEWTWVEQETRPFFFPAIEKQQPAVVRAVREVIDNAWSDL